ncbi:MAG TPA: hypothetical protein VFO05_04650 [Candidatus Limnocylindrales bacterium]|nr:hypothetical protein [Candidatus Limnocylindrales bacterium]
MLAEEMLKVITQERERQIAEAQRARSAVSAPSRTSDRRRWLPDLGAPAPSVGGRPHPGRAATESTL